MSLNIEFATADQKDSFTAKFGEKFGSMVDASQNISDYVENNDVTGTIKLRAFQRGGTPSDLGEIMGGSENLVQCSLSDMTACNTAVENMLNYATQEFPGQFSMAPPNRDLDLFGLAFTYSLPATRLGLTMPDSLVDPAMTVTRKQLENWLSESQYYSDMIGRIINYYPVPWQKESYLYASIEASYKKATANIEALMSYDDPQSGALGCWMTPSKCASINLSISSAINYIDYHSDFGWVNNLFSYGNSLRLMLALPYQVSVTEHVFEDDDWSDLQYHSAYVNGDGISANNWSTTAFGCNKKQDCSILTEFDWHWNL